MTDPLTALIERWRARRDELSRLGALVDGRKLCDQVLTDLTALSSIDDVPLTLTEAARCSGYSREHLGRLVRDCKIPNAGRPNAPRIRLRHLPCKAGYLPPERVPEHLSDASKRQIVRSVAGLEGRPKNAEEA